MLLLANNGGGGTYGVMKSADLIKAWRENRGWTQDELSEKANVSYSVVQKVEAGKLPVTRPIIRKIVEALGHTLEEHDNLTGFSAMAEKIGGTPPGVAMQTIRAAPETIYYDAAVAACDWLPLHDVYALDTHRQARLVDRGEFCVRVQGDCMETRWPHGSMVRFRIVRLDKESWPVGEDCLIIHSDDKVTFKNFYAIDDDMITLYARNLAKYPDPIIVPRQMVPRVAVAVAIETRPPKEPLKINGGKRKSQ